MHFFSELVIIDIDGYSVHSLFLRLNTVSVYDD